ncbi:LAME_0H19988g1_1 [Lachancea meyersii CBS 8951]|uniref:LAME_0H19988g1_1 n=1 Tax=Lachancea meyersii CBS 8951 TaxID=1266667 RepID=A0A1G4KJ89_9SACH|nr:LAME_0H19988g1_1 [Lachancea meyersii CBS 8951]
MYSFRKATLEDFDQIWSILESARELLKTQNIDQWQNGYPNRKVIKTDIKAGRSYVLVHEDGALAAMGAILVGIDPVYTAIDGKWAESAGEEDYASIHRTAISPEFRGKGISSIMMSGLVKICAELGYKDIRTDTHKDNKVMQRVLTKSGFEYRGEIYQGDQAWRQAYQFLLT